MHSSLLPVLDALALGSGAVAVCVASLRVRRIRARYEAALAAVDQDPKESARRAFVNLARRIQAVVNRQLRELREMESRHGADAEVFGDLLHLDHATALIGRLADSLAVLGGDRPRRHWGKPIPVLGVLRGSMSRITEYRRVEIGPLPEHVALGGEFAEPLIHALAELLDNATRYSPPESRVELNAYSASNGLVIEVVDGGVGMGPQALSRAELALRTESVGFELAALGQTPRQAGEGGGVRRRTRDLGRRRRARGRARSGGAARGLGKLAAVPAGERGARTTGPRTQPASTPHDRDDGRRRSATAVAAYLSRPAAPSAFRA
jgi:hypothetical protein